MSRAGSVLGCLLLAAVATTTAHDAAKPDYARMRRHAQRLSESCKRKGKTLEDACITDPETTGGPYVWDQAPIRKNITEGWPGIPLVVNITVMNSTTCTAMPATAVEIWHCTADGLYSHFVQASANNGTNTDNTTFLRGIQYTGDDGVVSFDTIFPGWYLPRATHIHVRVHFNITETSEGYSGGTVGHTGQLFFADDVVEELAVVYPYTTNKATRTKLAVDQVVGEQGGTYGLTTLTEMYPGTGLKNGVVATVSLGVDTTEAGGPANSGGSPPELPDAKTGTSSPSSSQAASETSSGGSDCSLVLPVILSTLGGCLIATLGFAAYSFLAKPSAQSPNIQDSQLLGDVSHIPCEKLC